MMPISVRRPVLADVPALAAINIATWRVAYDGIVPPAYLDRMKPAAYEQQWRARIRDEQSADDAFLAERGGAVVGYVVAGRYRMQQDAPREDTSGWGELYALYVHPASQRSGVGSRLHQEAMAYLSSHPYVQAALWVLEANLAGIAWYEAHGWRTDGATTEWAAAGVMLPEIRMVRRLPAALDGGGDR